jgi:hypothetical protein
VTGNTFCFGFIQDACRIGLGIRQQAVCLSCNHTHKTRNERDALEPKIIKQLIKERFNVGSLIPRQLPAKYRIICPFCSNETNKKTKLKDGRIVPWTGGVKGYTQYTCEKCNNKIIFYPSDQSKISLIYEPSYRLTNEGYIKFIKENQGEIHNRLLENFKKNKSYHMKNFRIALSYVKNVTWLYITINIFVQFEKRITF